jgi:hypothetical protein
MELASVSVALDAIRGLKKHQEKIPSKIAQPNAITR